MIDELINQYIYKFGISFPRKDNIIRSILFLCLIISLLSAFIVIFTGKIIILISTLLLAITSAYFLQHSQKSSLNKHYNLHKSKKDLWGITNWQHIEIKKIKMTNLEEYLKKKNMYTPELILQTINCIERRIKYSNSIVINFAIPTAFCVILIGKAIDWIFSHHIDTDIMIYLGGFIIFFSIASILFCIFKNYMIEAFNLKKQTLKTLTIYMEEIYFTLKIQETK